jgi:hypothetical protein
LWPRLAWDDCDADGRWMPVDTVDEDEFTKEPETLTLCWGGAEYCDEDVAVVLADDDREKLKLPLLERVCCDCSDMRELDRWRTKPS